MAENASVELQELDTLPQRFQAIKARLGEVIVGQESVIEHLLIATLCHGHVLLIGVPGLAKTLLVRTLADALDLSFSRIQFTPDLMPADILGSEILQTDQATGRRELRFTPGPIFSNIVLADELNRTPPKTQAALLEAMEERQVTVGGESRPLESPFLVMATQNPIEQEGAYPLPEAQLDRFLFTLNVDYPSLQEERTIAVRGDALRKASTAPPLFRANELVRIRALIGQTPVSDHVADYAVRLVRATRPDDPSCPEDVRTFLSWGAGPRAGQALLLAARCMALLTGDSTPTMRHVERLTPAVLRGRVVLSHLAVAKGLTADLVLQPVLRSVRPSS